MKLFRFARLVALALGLSALGVHAQTCTYSLSASNRAFTASGGAAVFSINAATNCNWTATNNVTWITISEGQSGTGTGTVSYTVAPNTTSNTRSGAVTAAALTYTVTQTGVQQAICPVKLTGILQYPDEEDTTVRVRLDKRNFVEEPENRLALELDPVAFTMRLIEIDADNIELNELARSERCVFLTGNAFAGDLLFDALPVFNEEAAVDFIGDGSLQVRGTFVTDTNGLPSRVTGKVIGVLNDPVNGNGDGPSAIFKGVLTPAGKSFTP